MKRPLQLAFWKTRGKHHGGALPSGKRKTARPLARKRPIHVVLRSARAKGKWSFLRQARAVERATKITAQRFGVRLLGFQNVGNHLHLAVQCRERARLQAFFRVIPQAIAFLVTGTRKGRPIGRFWEGLLFTRVVEWGRDWLGLKNHFEKNRWQAAGLPRAVVDRWFGARARRKGSG